MKISEYFDFLIKKYSLHPIYIKYIIYLYLFIFIRESFFWIIILTSQSKLQDKELMVKIIFILFSLLMISVIFENLYLKYKVTLKNSLNESHLKYSFHLINNCELKQVLSLNMVEQFTYIESVKNGLDDYVNKQQILCSLIATSITVLVSARKINVLLVSSLLVIFNSIIFAMQQKNIETEQHLNESNIENINKIRNYYIDSKQKIINNNFNFEYCFQIFNNYFKNNLTLVKIENSINTYNSITVLLITLIIVLLKYKTSSVFDIFVYLLIVYDLDYFVDSLFNYYKIVKSETKVNLHLDNLLQNKNLIQKEVCKFKNIDQIEIFKLYNEIPNLHLASPILLKKGDAVLCNGKSGEGKTTFLKFLKSIEDPTDVILKVNNNDIKKFSELNSKIFLSIQNNKVLFEEKLYNYVSNYSNYPDIVLIKKLIPYFLFDFYYYLIDLNKGIIYLLCNSNLTVKYLNSLYCLSMDLINLSIIL
jgi:ABC-type bacteriocin/lantibiotic exporter with double-glycine peptidase domain